MFDIKTSKLYNIGITCALMPNRILDETSQIVNLIKEDQNISLKLTFRIINFIFKCKHTILV